MLTAFSDNVSAITSLEALLSQSSEHRAAPKCLLQPRWLMQRQELCQFLKLQTLLMSLERPLGQWSPTQATSQMKVIALKRIFVVERSTAGQAGFSEMCFIPVLLVPCLLSLPRTLQCRPNKRSAMFQENEGNWAVQNAGICSCPSGDLFDHVRKVGYIFNQLYFSVNLQT